MSDNIIYLEPKPRRSLSLGLVTDQKHRGVYMTKPKVTHIYKAKVINLSKWRSQKGRIDL